MGVSVLLRGLIVFSSLMGVMSAPAETHTDANDTSICAPDSIALGGYDPVSYHQDHGPSLGTADFESTYDALIYRFKNNENRELFLTDPATYVPTYRGWCSTNLAMGRLVCPDYTNFKIENGRVLLFEHSGFTNGRDIWNSNPTLHKRRADENFLRFLR